MRRQPSPSARFPEPDAITLAAGTWLACGIVLLGLTPLPAHDAGWGWSPLFWLLIAPLSILCVSLRVKGRECRSDGSPRPSYALTPLRFASIRRSSSRMMRR